MACVKKNCNIATDERMVSCWLCLGLCHLKCSGLRARDADALGDASKCLQWTCPACRPIGIEFYKFFKSYKSEFDEIKTDFMLLKCKLEKYGEIFSNFSNLDAFSPIPKRSISSKKSASSPVNFITSNNVIVSDNSASVSDLNNDLNKNSPHKNKRPHNCAVSSLKSADPSQINQTSILNNMAASSSKKSPNVPLQLGIDSVPDSVYISSVNQPSELIVLSPLPSSNAEPNINAELNIKSSSHQYPSITEPKPLRVIPPMKTIFATRFAPDTSVLDVEFYIKNNITQGLCNNMKIFKIHARNRASFKIIVPEDLFETLVNPKFWPKNTIIKQFVYKNNDNVILPTNESLPKN